MNFRIWYVQNKDLSNSLFAQKFTVEFGCPLPEVISYQNSGIESFDNLNLSELESRIDKIINDAGFYFKNANPEKQGVIKQFQKHTYLAYSTNKISNNNTRFSDEKLKEFLKQYAIHFKISIKNLLLHYYRVKLNPELKFEGLLLDRLGFRPCASCSPDLAKMYVDIFIQDTSL